MIKCTHLNTDCMKHLLSLVTLVALLFSSCSREMTQAELFDLTKSGSVLILNKFYYRLQLPNNEVLYFSGVDAKGNLANVTDNEAEISKHCSVMSGTGFFVDEKGLIMTNRHVAQPYIEEEQIKTGYRNLLRSIAMYYGIIKQKLSDEYNRLENMKPGCYYMGSDFALYDDTEKLNQIAQQQAELREAYSEVENLIRQISALDDPRQLRISSVCELGIAYNDTHVTGEKDFLQKNPCVIIRVSDKPDVDLALIQLKNKQTPQNAYVFAIPSESDPLEMGQQLYMLGYNAGPQLATTKAGIQMQMTGGKVTQLSDGQRILYDIATVQGSSGSPVIDTEGNLVGVNFAKLNGSDNFNFGIPIERVREFMKR